MSDIATSIHDLEKKCVREMIYTEHKRPDGRKIDEIRPLSCEAGLLPRVHGSGLFTRGQTQVLSIATLGMVSEEQALDGIDTEESKRYMHQYNFPSYSVGEARPSRGPGRREIGHGALAEKALVPVIPSEEEFPYAIRVVSEVLSSNGSTSQASICASTLALMDAGVPIKRPVAGISTGLVTDPNGSDDYVMLTDIQGIEDFFGDMDFKVGGTEKGITAIQVDIKIDGQVFIYSSDEKQASRAKEIIEDIVREIEVGQVYEGNVTKIMNFGAFVDLGMGKEGLVHISKISKERVKNVEDVLHEGDKVKAKVIEIDDQGRINLSMKDVEENN